MNWELVGNCKHENHYDDYYASGNCGTPYCEWHEFHCKDCGAYIQECGCGYNNGISGWSHARYRAHRRKVESESNKRYNAIQAIKAIGATT